MKQSSDYNLDNDKIAIVGMSFKFPGGIENVDDFWQVLSEQQIKIKNIPSERQIDTPLIWPAGYLDSIDKFDAAFFNLSPREAQLMDPQQRLLLQVVWHAIEDAGYNHIDFAQRTTGLFIGVSAQDYHELLRAAGLNYAYTITGNCAAMLSNRISYWFNFTGPSEIIDTACSSSLVALHNAITSIKTKQCRQAIVAAANLLLTPYLFEAFTEAGMLSSRGYCKSFDHQADGYVRGEGVAAICLKPLLDAQNDGDSIYAVILASSINHGGKSNSLTAPNPNAQKELIKSAFKKAKIDLNTISYIEAHGTGTQLGDPIEIEALHAAFKEMDIAPDNQSPYCGIGTVKTNIGHLEAAAGLAGLIKVIISMQNKKLPGIVNFELLNPHISLNKSPFYIIEKTTEWPLKQNKIGASIPRRAGISSFGFGGSNAHVIIEEPCIQAKQENTKPLYLICISAKDIKSLEEQLNTLYSWLKKYFETSIEKIAYTLNVGRFHFNYRYAFIVDSVQTLLNCVSSVIAKPGLHQEKQIHYGVIENSETELRGFEDLAEFILMEIEINGIQDAIKYNDNLNLIAQLYVKGCKIELERIHLNESKQRAHLPGYKFLEKRYWYTEQITRLS